MPKSSDSGGSPGGPPPPTPISAAADPHLFPQWVTPHASQVLVTANGQVVVPGWAVVNVNRVTGAVTVLVNNPQELAAVQAVTVLTEK